MWNGAIKKNIRGNSEGEGGGKESIGGGPKKQRTSGVDLDAIDDREEVLPPWIQLRHARRVFLPLGCRFQISGLGFRVQGLGFRAEV